MHQIWHDVENLCYHVGSCKFIDKAKLIFILGFRINITKQYLPLANHQEWCASIEIILMFSNHVKHEDESLEFENFPNGNDNVDVM